MSARVLVTLLATLGVVAGAALPAAASTGGGAVATGVQAVAGEVTLTVTTDGAIGGLQPVVDHLTAEPLLGGQHLTIAEATTPPEPSGTETQTLGPASVGRVLSAEVVTAATERVEDGVLSASAGIGGASVNVLGLSVLDVGPVSAVATAHPSRPPTATAAVAGLEVFGSPVTVTPGKPVEQSLDLSTDQALDAVAELVPALAAVTGFAARTGGAGGSIDVRLSSEREVDEDAGAAHAVGLNAQVHLSLDLRLCLPELRGDGCVGEVTLRTDARVLDVQLGESRAHRPETTPFGASQYAVPLAVLLCLLASTAVYVGYRRKLPQESSSE